MKTGTVTEDEIDINILEKRLVDERERTKTTYLGE